MVMELLAFQVIKFQSHGAELGDRNCDNSARTGQSAYHPKTAATIFVTNSKLSKGSVAATGGNVRRVFSIAIVEMTSL